MHKLKLPPDNRLGPNCGITAFAVITGFDFSTSLYSMGSMEATLGYIKVGPRWPENPKTTNYGLVEALRRHGVPLVYKGTTAASNRPTLNQYVRGYCRYTQDKAFLVFTRRHVQVTHGLYVADQHGVKHISEYWAKRRKVLEVYTVDANKIGVMT